MEDILELSLGGIANEAESSNNSLKALKSVDETTNMTIDLITDEFIDMNIKRMKMQEVTNQSIYAGNSIRSSDGLMSEYIFGSTLDEQKFKYGYINLHCHVFHPFVYEVLKQLNQKKIPRIASGDGVWKVDDNGDIVEIIDESDPEYDESNTGIAWLYKVYDKLKWKRNASAKRDERVTMVSSLKRNEAFITKWLVIPLFYRDIVQRDNRINEIPDIDKWYADLIRYSQLLLKASDIDQMNKTVAAIQETLVTIRKYGQNLIEKKNGFFKKSVLGKSIDYGYRSVISVQSLQKYDRPSEVPINLMRTGIPLAQCCVLGFPFVSREVQQFIRQLADSLGNRLPVFKDDNLNEIIGYKEMEDPSIKFTTEYIKKKIDLFVGTPGTRFRYVTLRDTEGKDHKIRYTGTPMVLNNKIVNLPNRCLTWTDLLYIAAFRACDDKHVYITRYPLNDYFGTFPSRVFVMSTVKMCKMEYGEGTVKRTYNYYPDIDPSLPESVVSTLFNDTIVMTNAYLKGLNGDYDGDMVTCKMVFTQEANEEAEKLLNSTKHYVSIAGDAMRDIGKESILCAYCMTADPK